MGNPDGAGGGPCLDAPALGAPLAGGAGPAASLAALLDQARLAGAQLAGGPRSIARPDNQLILKLLGG